jgi:hypothetical protein
MLHRTVFAVAVLATLPALAHSEQRLHYVAYTAGFRVLDLQVAVDFGAGGYAVSADMRTLGLYNAFVGGDMRSDVRGTWTNGGAAPEHYDSEGRWNGERRQTEMIYAEGNPEIRVLTPPITHEREPVPPTLQDGTIDSLSAMVSLMHAVAQSGRCEGTVRMFDGRRLSLVTAHTAGMQTLQPTERSVFQGPALRCEFEGRLIAGFRFDDDRARVARPQHGIAWLAAPSGGQPVPVRIQFETPFFGASTMYLTQ